MSCSWFSDTEKPVIDFCESPPEFITNTDDVDIEWDEPLFHDNSREPLTIVQTHKFGKFPFGDTVVTYAATDRAGNSATCRITITLASKIKHVLLKSLSIKHRTLLRIFCELIYHVD